MTKGKKVRMLAAAALLAVVAGAGCGRFVDTDRIRVAQVNATARAVAVTYLDIQSSLKVLANTRAHAPQIPVVVRTQDDLHLDKLRNAGATEVVPEAIEGSLMLASHALALVGVPMRRVLRLVQDQRDARYNLLRGYFHGADDDTANEIDQERMTTVTLPPGAATVGQALGQLALHAMGAKVVNLRHSNGRMSAPLDEIALAVGDTLVLSGHPAALALAEDRLLRG